MSGSESGADRWSQPIDETTHNPGDGVLEEEPVNLRAAAAVSGDQEALRELWVEHRRWVAAILLAHKPSWADVDDLLQEVAVSLVRKIGELRDPRAVKPWLRTVAMNAAHAAARRGKARPPGSHAHDRTTRDAADVGDVGDTSTPPEAIQRGETGGRLMALAGQLGDGYREPLLLKVVHNLSYRQIGQILGLPETTVETRIARARRQLRDLAEQKSLV